MTGPACDFCNEPGATWRYPTRDFGALFPEHTGSPGHLYDLSGGWWACDHCAEYVDAGRYDELARNTFAKWRAVQTVPLSRTTARYVWTTHRDMYRAFERNRCGDPTRYVRRKVAS